jgi:hypothetical protein
MPRALAIWAGLSPRSRRALAAASLSASITGRAAAAAALCPCCDEAGHGPLVDDVALQLGEGGHHGEEELAFAGRGVGAGQLAGQDADIADLR